MSLGLSALLSEEFHWGPSQETRHCSQLLVVWEGWGWGDSGLSDHQAIKRVLGAPSHPLSLQHQRLKSLSPDGGRHRAPTELQESESLCPQLGLEKPEGLQGPSHNFRYQQKP